MKNTFVRILIGVFIAHIVVLCVVVFYAPTNAFVVPKNKIVVNTFIEKSKPIQKNQLPKKVVSKAKSPVAKKGKQVSKKGNQVAPVKKKVVAKEKVKTPIERAREVAMKLKSESSKSISPDEDDIQLDDLKRIDSLNSDLDHLNQSGSAGYHSLLVTKIRSYLKLPEVGDVRIQLTVKRSGQVADVAVLSSESSYNSKFVTSHLKSLQCPPFGRYFSGENAHTFSLTLTNE